MGNDAIVNAGPTCNQASESTEKVKSLARINVELLRLVRTLRDKCGDYAYLLSVALEMMHDDHRKSKAADERYLWLLEQYRALRDGKAPEAPKAA